MIVAYLTALYPKTSHAFVRREIAALERLDFTVLRFSTRRVTEPLVDPDDERERQHTRALLDAGAAGLLCSAGLLALRNPLRWTRALLRACALGWRSESGTAKHLVYFCEACELVRQLRRARAEHLHAHFTTNSATIALLARLLGGPPFSFTAHGTDAVDNAPLLALREKIREARFVVAVSQNARAHLMRFSDPEDWDRIHVVRCGVDEGFLREAPSAPAVEPRFLCIARLDAEKGHFALLEAAALLRRAGARFELVLVGDGPLRAEIERRIERLGLSACVELAGWLGGEAIRARLGASRCLVLPSLGEGLPVVLMEAFALGRPVIASNVGGVAELVVPGENGWLVPPADVEALASALGEALAASDAVLERMGRSGRERVLARHDVQRETQKLAGILRDSGAR